MNHAVYLLNILVQVMLLVFFDNQLLVPKKSFLRITMLMFVPFIIIYIASLLAGDTNLDSQWNIISRFALIIIIPLISYYGNFFKKLFIAVLYTVFQLFCEDISLYVVSIIFGKMSQKEMIEKHILGAGQIIVMDILLIFIIAAALVINHKKFKLEKSIPHLMYMAGFISVHFIFLIMYYSFNKNNVTDINNMIQLGFQSLLIIMVFIQYYNSLNTNRLRESEVELKSIQNRIENDYNYYMLADSKFNEISELRHDIQNQFQTIRVLLNTTNGRERAENIIDNIQQRLLSVKAVNYCDNHTINAVLTVKLNEERLCGIQTHIILKDCAELPFDDYDLCSLVSNLFDNAVESCLRSEDKSKTFIDIKSGIQNNMFIIKFSNSCFSEINKRKSSKIESGHGYGIKIAENICRKYNGSFSLERNDNTAVAIAVLSLKF